MCSFTVSVNGLASYHKLMHKSDVMLAFVTERHECVLSVGGQNPDGMETSFKAWDGLGAECSCGSSTDCITLFRAFPPVCDLREDAALCSDHYN